MICEFVNWALEKYPNYVFFNEYQYDNYESEVNLISVVEAILVFFACTLILPFILPFRVLKNKCKGKRKGKNCEICGGEYFVSTSTGMFSYRLCRSCFERHNRTITLLREIYNLWQGESKRLNKEIEEEKKMEGNKDE